MIAVLRANKPTNSLEEGARASDSINGIEVRDPVLSSRTSRPPRVILRDVNRRLRLLLFLAALAAIGPVSSARVFDPSTTQPGLTWVRALRAAPAHMAAAQPAHDVLASNDPLVVASGAIVPDTFHAHALFQRPPPFEN